MFNGIFHENEQLSTVSDQWTTYESSQSQSPGSVPSIRLKLPVTKPFLSSRFDIWSTFMVILTGSVLKKPLNNSKGFRRRHRSREHWVSIQKKISISLRNWLEFEKICLTTIELCLSSKLSRSRLIIVIVIMIPRDVTIRVETSRRDQRSCLYAAV